MIIVFILFLCLLLYGAAEYRCHRNNIDKVPLRILVNGTRGKTTVTRIIAYCLQGNGIKTMARTSGSSLEIIHCDGSVEKLQRKRNPRILEMISFFRLAREENAEAVVIECMALQEENQKTIADTLVRPGIVVMTNTFIDHVPEMGNTLSETAWVLSRSVPKGGILYTTEDYYDNFGFEIRKVDTDTIPPESSIPIHASSWAIARKVLLDLGVKEDIIASQLMKIPPDIGLMKEMKGKKGSILIPSFSVNDKECMAMTIREEIDKHPTLKPIIVFNNRKDREHRIKLLKEVLMEWEEEKRPMVEIIGEYKGKVSFYFNRRGIEAFPSSVEDLAERIENERDTLFIGVGNIKGDGEKLMASLMEEN